MMKKGLKSLMLLLFTLQLGAQSDFKSVDQLARSIRKTDYASPEILAKALCKDLKTETEKARAIFTWVAVNMRYDLNGVGQEGPEADSQQEYDAKRVKQAYRRGRGICMDYALLYKNMADAVGLECVFIPGNSKGSVRGGWGNHAWNAVKINGQWHLLDVTWGSGHVKDDEKFYAVFQPGFFFTPPRIFALDHFPEDEKWQLLETPLSKSAFKNQVNFSYGDPDKDIQDCQPFNTPLVKAADGKVELKLKIKQAPSVIQLKAGGKEIKFDRIQKDGWLVLRFAPNNGRELQLWGGEKTKKGILVTLMGIFPAK